MQPDFENLVRIFKEMNENGFDTSKELKWGFFFFDDRPDYLLQLVEILKEDNYMQEELESTDDGEWRLQISKIEVLTPEKLHKRNIAFNELAEHCSVGLYDGWDVEQVT